MAYWGSKAGAGAIFSGLDLIGMSFFSLLQEKCNAAVIRRMMLVNQSMADSSRWVSVRIQFVLRRSWDLVTRITSKVTAFLITYKPNEGT